MNFYILRFFKKKYIVSSQLKYVTEYFDLKTIDV